MASIVTSQAVEGVLRRVLRREGFALSKPRVNGETGVDLLAKRGRMRMFIEVISHKSRGSARSRDFMQCFFRAISRLDGSACRCVIAMSSHAERGLPRRAKQYGSSWTRLGEAFPELEIWLVDIEAGSYRVTPWNEWAASQKP